MKFLKLPSGTSYYSEEKILPEETLGISVELGHLIEDVTLELAKLKQSYIEKEEKAITEKKEAAYLEALTLFNQHILALDAELKTLRTHLMGQVLPLALTAAKKIVAENLKLHPETIVAMVQKQLHGCTSCHKVKILVAKEDKHHLDAHKPELKARLDQLESLAIEESEEMSPGSFMILTEAGNINGSLELQWKALEGAFDRYMGPS